VDPLTRGLKPSDSHSLCPLSSTEFVEHPLPRKNLLGTPLIYTRKDKTIHHSSINKSDYNGKGVSNDKTRGKVHRVKGHEGPEGKFRYSSTLSLTSALVGGEGSIPRPGRFITG
jgi:hypothetical protein